MAQVAHETQPQPDIDYHLDYQFRAWGSIVEYAAWWPGMDTVAKEVFHLEWIGITERRFQELGQWAQHGLLTPAQRARYEQLLKLVAQNRPILESMLNKSE